MHLELEDGSGRLEIEDGSGLLLLEGSIVAAIVDWLTIARRRTRR